MVEAVGTSGGGRGGSSLAGGVQEGVSWWGGCHLGGWLVLFVRGRAEEQGGGVVWSCCGGEAYEVVERRARGVGGGYGLRSCRWWCTGEVAEGRACLPCSHVCLYLHPPPLF